MRTKAVQSRGIETYAKNILVQMCVKEYTSVCEINPEDGANLGKFERAKIRNYVCIEPNKEKLRQTQVAWEKRGEKFKARFYPSFGDVLKHDDISFPTIVCFSNLETHFESLEKSTYFFKSISTLCAKGGNFIGLASDSSSIWRDCMADDITVDQGKRILSNKLFELCIPEHVEKFGTKFKLAVTGEDKPQENFLIHNATFSKLARDHGFEVVSMENLSNFYQDHKIYNQEMLFALHVHRKKDEFKVDPLQMDIVSYHMIIILKKL